MSAATDPGAGAEAPTGSPMNERVELDVLKTARPVAASPLPSDHPVVRSGRVGVLLMNLGTPEGTTYWPMRRYLKEFLSDRRVI